MRILSITAQKPDSTGSGVYLTEVVREFSRQGHEQAVLAGVYREDEVRLPAGVDFFPVFFHSEELPFAIPGMSDRMPYESTVYSAMDEGMTETYMKTFRRKIREAVESFQPDLILCHHLRAISESYKGLREGDSCLWLLPQYGPAADEKARSPARVYLQPHREAGWHFCPPPGAEKGDPEGVPSGGEPGAHCRDRIQ